MMTVNVSTTAELTSALAKAVPGTKIILADGTYRGHFTLSRNGTAVAPITIAGGRGAHLDGGSVASGYVLHLDGANHVRVTGLSIENGQKAVVLDASNHVLLDGLDLSHTGDEVILLRNNSRDNIISGSDVHDSGLVETGYGEGIYVGLSRSNWSGRQSRTSGAPDASDRNTIIGNNIWDTTAECIDIKEGTTGGVISGNYFGAARMSGVNYADSWVDLQGNGYLVSNNVGVSGGSHLLDEYQTHVIVAGWGKNNVFRANSSSIASVGYGFSVQGAGMGNVIYADNTATGAARGLANVKATPVG